MSGSTGGRHGAIGWVWKQTSLKELVGWLYSPMVEICEGSNSLSVNRRSIHVFPTPESPSMSSLNNTSYCLAMTTNLKNPGASWAALLHGAAGWCDHRTVAACRLHGPLGNFHALDRGSVNLFVFLCIYFWETKQVTQSFVLVSKIDCRNVNNAD